MSEETPSVAGTVAVARAIAKGRLESLTDGILAVAMTILVLDLKFDGSENLSSDAHLISYLIDIGRTFAVYIVSFVVLGMYWIAHSMQFHYVRRVDRGMLWINLGFMLLVTTVPFTTSVMIRYEELLLPVVLYGVNQFLLGAMLVLNLIHLSRHRSLADESLTTGTIQFLYRRLAWFCGIPAASIAVAFFSTHAALYLYGLMAVVHFFPKPLDSGMRRLVRTRSD